MRNDEYEVDAVRVMKSIKEEKNLYILVSESGCFAKFAYENRPENQELRDIITTVCDAVTEGQERIAVMKAVVATKGER